MSPFEFLSGILFGAALFAAGVWAPDVIKSQMTFDSNAMIIVMMAASATSAIILDIEDRLKLVPKSHRPPVNLGFFRYDGNILGGILIGIGMSATGACPGTSLVQAGAGMANGVLTMIGGVFGALAFTYLQPALKEFRNRLAQTESLSEDHSGLTTAESKRALDIATALGLPPLVMLLVWIPMCLASMQLVFAKDHSARMVPNSGLVRPAIGGLSVGLAQLATTLLTKHSIGASAAYQDIAAWINSRMSRPSEDEVKPEFWTSSVTFSGGVVCAAAALSHLALKRSIPATDDLSSLEPKIAVQAVTGGMIMVLGARFAGGCTSGHGISGLATFSLSSLVTTVSLFSAGVVTASITA